MVKQQSRRRGLGDYCQYLKGVGPVRAQRLLVLGIETVGELLTHFPRKYHDRRNLVKISGLAVGDEQCFSGRVLSLAQRGRGRRRGMVTAAIGDDTGVVTVLWFNQPYLVRVLKPGLQVLVTGVLSYYKGTGQRQLVNPEFEVLGEELDRDLIHTGRIVPVYPLTSGVSQRQIRELLTRALDAYGGDIVENLPRSLVEVSGVCDRLHALRGIHFPDDESHYTRARQRLKLEELFFMQLSLSLQRRSRFLDRARPRFHIGFEMERRFLEALPFELTRAQRRVIDDIHDDLTSARGMHRLLQGDVGCGKTIVAGATLLAAVEAGAQAALMVPTEILAVQHAKTLAEFFRAVDTRVVLLVGSLKAAEKRAIHAGIADGSVSVVVGTHALIQSDVHFKNLGIVVIDEQHRFGVRQRAALLSDARNPHMLVMTATPIPRTLALTAYADLDLSVIDEFPPGRAEVRTRVVVPTKREAMYRFIRDEIDRGAQAYLLYPLIEETEKQDLEAAVSAHEDLSKGVFRGTRVGLLHGRMTLAEKESVMEEFGAGLVKLLVTTTVVEVGVHVPAATIMVIHHPERFGLSQLHQLRGRVGRGGKPGFCFLALTQDAPGPARERLSIMTRVTDGFRIAEEDLRIRGPGEFFGVRQHGVPGLKIANPAVDGQIVELAQRHVKALLEKDPHLKGVDARGCLRFLRDMRFDMTALPIG